MPAPAQAGAKKRTLLNLSDWPADRVAGFKMLLKGGTVIPQDQQAITITRSLPHGHVAAALGMARKIGLDRLLGPEGNRCRDLVKERFDLDHVVLVVVLQPTGHPRVIVRRAIGFVGPGAATNESMYKSSV